MIVCVEEQFRSYAEIIERFERQHPELRRDRLIAEACGFLTQLGLDPDKPFELGEVLGAKYSTLDCAGCEDPDRMLRICKGRKRRLFNEPDCITSRILPCDKPLHMRQQEDIRQLIEEIPSALRDKSLANFDTSSVSASVRKAAEIAEESIREGGSLVLAGSVGTGKTHLAAAIVMQAIRAGRPALFVGVPHLMTQLKSFGPNGNYRQLLAAVSSCEVLALDDMGTERYTDWVGEQLFMLIDERYINRRQTVVTTNYATPDELIARMDYAVKPDGNRERVGRNGQRIVSRLSEMGEWVKVTGDDQRIVRSFKVIQGGRPAK